MMDIIEEIKKLPKKRIRTFDSHFHYIIDFDQLTQLTEELPKTIKEALNDTMPEVEIPEAEPEPEEEVVKDLPYEEPQQANDDIEQLEKYQEELKVLDTDVEERKLAILQKKKELLEQIAKLEKKEE